MESAQGGEVYLQLQTLYAEHEALLQYFEGVNKQFLSWLNGNPFNSAVISGILPKLEPVFSSLARLKFDIMDLEEEDVAPQTTVKLTRLKRNIVALMTYQEVSLYQTRIEQLIEQNDVWQLENSKTVEREQKEKQQRLFAEEREKQVQRERKEKEQQQRSVAEEREKQIQREREQKEQQQRLAAEERTQQIQREEKERQRGDEQLKHQLKAIFEDNKTLLSDFKGVVLQFNRLLTPTTTVQSLVQELVTQHRKILADLQVLKLLMFDMQTVGISEGAKPKWAFLDKDTKGTMTWQQIPTFIEQWRNLLAENQVLRQREIKKIEDERKRQEEIRKGKEQPDMVVIRGGTFTMGEVGVAEPLHQVTLSTFAISKYPITQFQWTAIMGTNPSYFKGDNLPVEQVSWDEANEYIARLNQNTGKNYRLPTEAEWEYAAKGGQDYEYGCTDNINEVAWFNGNSGNTTHPVGTKRPNGYGLYDMLGNVWEWCQDWYEGYGNVAVTNPTGAKTGSARVDRGGSWGLSAVSCRPTVRNYGTPTLRSNSIGFRVCLTHQ
jgi:formylglycine-generating enzyme required for sulfatase activity